MKHFNKICRACLISSESFKYCLFDNVSVQMYSFCTSIEVLKDEDLPKTLCDSCYELLLKLSNFKKICIQSQNTLFECKKTVKVENEVTRYIEDDTSSFEDYEPELEGRNIKTEFLADTELKPLCNNVFVEKDVDELKTHNLNELIYEVSKKQKPKRLRKLKTTKQLLVKSVSKINYCIPKKTSIFSCKLCKKIFSYSERYEAHKLEHEGKKVPIHCPPCDKTFMTWSGFRRHNESEHTRVSLESLKCRTCGKASKNRHTLRMHEKTHGDRRTCICDVCGRRFATTSVLKAHLETHEENRERKYECEQCNKKFFSNTVLLSHISKRHSGRRFICQVCNYPFTEKHNLARHMHLHDGKKLFKCDLCDKSYAASSSLVEHKRIHSGERPFACIYCPKSFPSKKRLDDHHRIHTGEKPHKCGVCTQGFTQRGTLKRHMKVHDKFPTTLN